MSAADEKRQFPQNARWVRVFNQKCSNRSCCRQSECSGPKSGTSEFLSPKTGGLASNCAKRELTQSSPLSTHMCGLIFCSAASFKDRRFLIEKRLGQQWREKRITDAAQTHSPYIIHAQHRWSSKIINYRRNPKTKVFEWKKPPLIRSGSSCVGKLLGSKSFLSSLEKSRNFPRNSLAPPPQLLHRLIFPQMGDKQNQKLFMKEHIPHTHFCFVLFAYFKAWKCF